MRTLYNKEGSGLHYRASRMKETAGDTFSKSAGEACSETDCRLTSDSKGSFVRRLIATLIR
jgi:hypothetical protein